MEPGKEVIEQKESIINYLAATYDVQKSHIRDILPLSEAPFFSIKPVHGETQQNGFILFQVKLKKNAKQQLGYIMEKYSGDGRIAGFDGKKSGYCDGIK